MAVSLNLVTFSGGTVAPKTDGIIYDSAIGQCGVFYGCNVTADGNTVYVSSGYGIIRGRFFEMNDSSVAVTLSSSKTLSGRIYLRLDLSNATAPLQLLAVTGSTLPDLTQEEDANFTNGVWEMELATFDSSTSSVDNVVETYETITDNGSLISALQSAVDTLNSKYLHESYTSPATNIAPGGTASVTTGISKSKTGYTLVGAVVFVNHAYLVATITDEYSSFAVNIHNFFSGAQSAVFKLHVLWMKS